MLRPFWDRLRTLTGRRSSPHLVARDYWRQCSNTFLASDPTYYDRQEAALRSIVTGIDPHPLNALDVGCGSGRFSVVLAEQIKHVQAFDLSETLIAEARALALKRQAKHLHFESRDLEAGFPPGIFDLVACMGVTSTLIDEGAFAELVKQLHQSGAAKGHLITKDSLSAGEDRAITSGAYITIYRAVDRYKRQFSTAGFKLLKEHELANDSNLINHLYLWERQ